MRRLWPLSLGFIWVYLCITPAIAQEDGVQPLSLPLRSDLLQPNLPPLRPLFPEVNEIRLLLKLKERRVYVYDGDQLKTSYPVAVGRAGWETPTGQFRVIAKLKNPGWTNPFTGEVLPPGSDNPLGERWIAFWTDGQNDIGFHGTPNRESVGQAASHGCVRMFNEHIREMFEWVEPGTVVTVEP
jgi:L,D-transpeptidase ErfK/SrfK